jgi:hypothetical protein
VWERVDLRSHLGAVSVVSGRNGKLDYVLCDTNGQKKVDSKDIKMWILQGLVTHIKNDDESANLTSVFSQNTMNLSLMDGKN